MPPSLRALAVVGASGLAFLGSQALHPVAALAWIAPTPVLWYAARVDAGRAAAVAALAYLTGWAGYAHYLGAVLETPWPVVAAQAALTAGVFAGVTLLFRLYVRRQRPGLAVVVTAGAWAAAEHVVATVTPYGANWSLATSQAGVPPVIQLAALTGGPGVSFLVMGAAAAAAVLLMPIGRAARLRVLAAVALVALATLGWGTVRLATGEAPTVPVTLAAVRHPGYQADVSTAEGRAVVDADLDFLASLPTSSGIVVFPETDVEVREAEMDALVARFADVAVSRDLVVVLGVARYVGGERHNSALVFTPGRAEPDVYDKQYPMPGQEAGTVPGAHNGFVPGTSQAWGVAICADLAHPALARGYADDGAGLVLAPALDFDVDAWSQSRVQLLRAVESGFSLARGSREGYLTLADDRGRVVAERSADDDDQVTWVSAELPLGSATPYARFGDWFGWLCLVVAAAAVSAPAWWRRRRGHDRFPHKAARWTRSVRRNPW